MESQTPAAGPVAAAPPNPAGQQFAPAAPGEARRKLRVTKVGRVVSTKMQKTIVVEVETRKPHRLYKKTIRRTTKFKAHDEHEKAQEGDLVRIVECRPISKDKHFRLAEIIEKREAPIDVKREVRDE